MTRLIKSSSFDKHSDEFREYRDIYQKMFQHKRSPQTKRTYLASEV